MKKIIKIGVILAVLLSLASFASAGSIVTDPVGSIDVNIDTNEPSQVVVTHTDSDKATAIRVTVHDMDAMAVTDDFKSGWDYLTSPPGTWSTSTSTTTVDMVSQSHDINTGLWTTVWNCFIKDAEDTDDLTQMAINYEAKFEVDTNVGGTFTYSAAIDSIGVDVVPVPEFPTIALPIAAILGLAFIFQRRREEE